MGGAGGTCKTYMQASPEFEVHLECLEGVHFNYYVPEIWAGDVVVEGLQPPKQPKRANYQKTRSIVRKIKYDSYTDSSSDESSCNDATTDAESQPQSAVIS